MKSGDFFDSLKYRKYLRFMNFADKQLPISRVNQIRLLWSYLQPDKKRQIYAYALLTTVSAISDIVSIGSVIPFIMVFVDPAQVYEIEALRNILDRLSIDNEELRFFLCLTFSTAVIFSGAVKISLAWFQSRLSYSVAADLGNDVFTNSLNQSYEYHLTVNSNDIISAIANKANIVADNVIHPLLSFLLAFVTVIAIALLLLFINPLVTTLVFLLIVASYWLAVQLTKNVVRRASSNINKNFDAVMRIIRDGLEGIRYVILTASQNVFSREHFAAEKVLRMSQADVVFASLFPRALVETLALLVFAWVIFWFIDPESGSSPLISLMGAIVMAVQRLLPVAQQAYFGLTKLLGAADIIGDTLRHLEGGAGIQQVPSHSGGIEQRIPLRSGIKLTNVAFAYGSAQGKPILENIDLEIPAGSRVGITGPSGSGKSTLIDIIMGFLQPSIGEIRVDGVSLESAANRRRWHGSVSLVPQEVHLIDSSILKNIVFGTDIDNIDLKKVEEVAGIAQLTDFIENLVDGFEHVIGEGGKGISQGQRQRIGIARALYREADLLVFDEGTSALDSTTQKRVIHALNELPNSPTILMVAHRVEILENYDFILRVEGGRVFRDKL